MILNVSASIHFKLIIGKLNDLWNLYLKIWGEMNFAETSLEIGMHSAVTDRI